eukprot:COSAG05_NODE_602_length_8420_cov_13.540199_2_plen_84_part_00
MSLCTQGTGATWCVSAPPSAYVIVCSRDPRVAEPQPGRGGAGLGAVAPLHAFAMATSASQGSCLPQTISPANPFPYMISASAH